MAEPASKVPVKNEKTTRAMTTEWSPFESLQREIDRLFEDFRPLSRPSWRSMLGLEMPRHIGPSEWRVMPAIDLTEKEDEYELTAELPGLDEKDVEVKLANDMLTLRGDKQEEKEEKRKDFHMSERRFGSFQRSFHLPEDVDADKIEANFTKGVLKLKLPKSMEAKQAEKKIEVKGA